MHHINFKGIGGVVGGLVKHRTFGQVGEVGSRGVGSCALPTWSHHWLCEQIYATQGWLFVFALADIGDEMASATIFG